MNSLPDSPGSIYVPNNQGVVAQTVEQLNVFSGETTDQLVTRYYRKLAKECEVATTQAHHPLETKGVASASKVGAVYVEPDVWELFELKKPTAKDVEVDTTEIEVEVGENRKITSAKRRRPWRECFESTVEEFKRLWSRAFQNSEIT